MKRRFLLWLLPARKIRVHHDDGTCLAPYPGNPEIRCGRPAGHGPGDMHDSGYFTEHIPHLWPNPADGK